MRKKTKKESTSFVSNCFLSRSCIAVLSIREKHNKNRYKWWNFERAPVDLWKNNHYDTFFWPNNSDNELFMNCYSLPSKMKITVRKVLPGLLLYQLYEVSVFARHRMKKYRTKPASFDGPSVFSISSLNLTIKERNEERRRIGGGRGEWDILTVWLGRGAVSGFRQKGSRPSISCRVVFVCARSCKKKEFSIIYTYSHFFPADKKQNLFLTDRTEWLDTARFINISTD